MESTNRSHPIRGSKCIRKIICTSYEKDTGQKLSAVAVYCNAPLQYIVTCYGVLQCVAVCCSVLQGVPVSIPCLLARKTVGTSRALLQSVAVCCSVWFCVAECRRVLRESLIDQTSQTVAVFCCV